MRVSRRLAVAATVIVSLPGLRGYAQEVSPRPQFDVASIKRNSNCQTGTGRSGIFPGKLELPCVSLRGLIRMAYGDIVVGGNLAARGIEVLGGPGWLDTDRYDVSAKAEGTPSQAQVTGPMLQALLEERFKVKVHRESRDTGVYLLTVARDGSKLQPSKERNWKPFDLTDLGPPVRSGEPLPKRCGGAEPSMGRGGRMVIDFFSVNMAEYAGRWLTNFVDHPVVDKTGLTGRFDIHLVFVPTPSSGPVTLNGDPVAPPPSSDAMGPSIFTALEEQLGLKLLPGKAHLDVIVVDRAEKPSAN